MRRGCLKKELNRKHELIYGELFKSHIQYRNDRIQDMAAPLNDIVWQKALRFEDKSISMVDMFYVEYQDLLNQSVKPFKKR